MHPRRIDGRSEGVCVLERNRYRLPIARRFVSIHLFRLGAVEPPQQAAVELALARQQLSAASGALFLVAVGPVILTDGRATIGAKVDGRGVETASVSKLFVLVWSRHDIVHTWLDGYGALNLHTRAPAHTNDPLLLAAAKMIKNEDYNGLSSGHGKDVVVQLVRAFADEGYPVEPDPWLRAYFAVGGSIRHAESVARLVKEMKAGRKHRVKQHYREDIVDVLRAQLVKETDAASEQS